MLRAADAALCKSGTTTLEAAVAGCPLVICYRTNALTWLIGRPLLRTRFIGLVNIVAGREVTHEYLQDAMTPAALAAALGPLLDAASAERQTMLADLAEVHARLGAPGAAERVATMVSALAP